jgi:hypothetical protein
MGAIDTFRTMLDKAGVKYVYFASPGTTQEWLTLRRDLIDLASSSSFPPTSRNTSLKSSDCFLFLDSPSRHE